ncbi:TonB-dependent receptor plug domain-containing protein, partial [Acinetobacter baumannii]
TSSNVGFLGSKKFLDTPFNTISYTDKYIEDKQAKDITEVIAATDPSIYTNGASGGWSENYYIRGYASSTNDMSMNGLFGITPFYRTSPEMFSHVEVLKGPSALLNGMPP